MNAIGPFSIKSLAHLAVWVAAWPFLAIVGVIVTVAAAASFGRKLGRMTRARRDELVCPRGHANDVVGRWGCDRCGAEYLGWVGGCENCGDESADWFPCERCGLSVGLPWRSPP